MTCLKEINLLNKKILYIGPASFHYDKYLVKKIIDLGADVLTYDLDNLKAPINLYSRVINKLNPQNREIEKEVYKNNFYNKILSAKGFDFVLVRQGYQIEEEFILELRKVNPNAKFINFQWDSIRPEYDYSHIIKHFDTVYSFDHKDCETYEELTYLPLFYLDIYEQFRKNNLANFKEKKNDILFIGSWRNIERYNLIKLTENLCEEAQLRFYYYLHSSFKNQYYSIKKGIIPKKARSKKLSHKEILDLFATTNTIIDFPSSFQTGLTIRTFETLGAGKKLITTNKNIVNEPFYNPEYINIIDTDNFTLNTDFIKNTPSNSIEENIKDYSIGSYVKKLFQ